MKKLSTAKFHNFSRSTTFILMVFFKRGHLKNSKIQFQIISRNMIFTGGFLGEPAVEIHDFCRRFSLADFELGPPISFYRRSLIETACKN